ncbi:MAG: NAD(P)/FAD-dependent oxidoreductase [Dehalococcoidia bacterium]
METYDCVVVGAGPAGSTAARLLASGGAKVLLLDRAEFPRDKPCGGGVTVRAHELIPSSFDGWEQEIREARFSYKEKPSFSYSAAQPLAYVTQRRKLDLFLAAEAEKSGATFRDGVKVTSVTVAGQISTVETSKDSYTARVAIGADGANGVVARAVGLTPRLTHWVALEGNAVDPARVRQWSGALGFDFGSVPGGYGWLFPRGEHINIGVGGWESTGPQLRALLDVVSRHYGVRAESLCDLKGHTLPLRRPGAQLAKGNVLLVGDAAALVDPLSGEGIHSALLSGVLAAKAVAGFLAGRNALDQYQADVDRELSPELVTAARLHALFHRSPNLYLAVLKRSPWIWRRLVSFVRGESTYATIRDSFGPLGVLAAVASRTIGKVPEKPEPARPNA